MNPEIKKRWVAALRSGEYEQGSEVLRTLDNKFCCLGVLCDLHAKETGKAWLPRPSDSRYTYRGGASLLPISVHVWADLDSTSPKVKVDNHNHKQFLTMLNDIERLTFNEIADIIEKQP